MKKKTIIVLSLILILGGFLRFYKLASIPPGLYPDEAINGNNAYEALENNHFQVFYPDNNGREGLFINLTAYSIKYFGLKPFSIRLVSATVGFLTILGIFLLTKELFLSETIALFSSFFLAISYWHLNFSRIGFRAILVPLIMVYGFYFFFKYLRKKEVSNFLYSAFFFGLGFYTYIAYRVIPLLVLVPLIFEFLKQKNKKIKFITTWFIFAFLVVLFVLPLAIYFYHNPSALGSRTGDVSIFSQASPLKSFLISTGKTIGMFFVRGDCNWRHNLACQPELFYFQQILFVLGLFFGLKEIKESRKTKNTFIFLFSWLLIMAIPEVLTYESVPHALRSIGMIPAVFVFVGFGAFKAFEVSKNRLKPKVFLVSIASIVLILSGVTFYRYFFAWAKNQATKDAFSENYSKLAKKINSLPLNIEKYIICDIGGEPVRDRSSKRDLPMSTQSVMFLTNSFLAPQRAYRHIHYVLEKETGKIPNKKNIKIFKLSENE